MKEQLERLKNAPIVETFKGRTGEVIGKVVSSPVMGEVKEGMIVLFKSPPPEGKKVALLEYVVRQSKNNPEKKYIKCFNWVTKERLPELIEEVEWQLARYNQLRHIPTLVKLLSVPPSQLERILSTGNFDLIVQALHEVTKKVVVVDEKCLMAYIPLHSSCLVLTFEYHKRGVTLREILVEDFPIETIPTKALGAKYIVLDDAFEGFEVAQLAQILASRGYPVFYLVSSSPALSDLGLVIRDEEVFKKLLAIKETSMPRFLKGLCYLEVLGVKPTDISYSEVKP